MQSGFEVRAHQIMEGIPTKKVWLPGRYGTHLLGTELLTAVFLERKLTT